LDAASDLDLLVVGGGSPSSADDSVSALCLDLVARAPCPVVVVRGRQELIESTGPSAAEPAPAGGSLTTGGTRPRR
jgi:hypothetical protein